MARNPFEYIAQATREEHLELSKLLAKMMKLMSELYDGTLETFRQGAQEFTVPEELLSIRAQLKDSAKGQDATSMFLSQFFEGGELQDEIEPDG